MVTEEVNFDFSRVWIHIHNSSHIVTSGVVAPKDDDFLLSRVLEYLRVERQRFSRRLSRVWAQDSIEFIFIAILAVPIVVVDFPQPFIVCCFRRACICSPAKIGTFPKELAYSSVA